MSGYIGNIPTPQATQTRDTFTATAGQITFATSGYTPSFLDVFLNGVHLVNGTDYTASNGSDVVLTSGAAAGDTLEVVAFSTFEASDVTASSGFTVTGNLSVDGGTIKLDGNYPVGTSNVALGDAALNASVTGGYSTAVGHQALTAMTSGNGNIGIGFAAGDAITSGSSNVAVGTQALTSNTTASSNTAVGYQAGYTSTTATENALHGYRAGYTVTTGSQNSFFGAGAGSVITTGSKNTIIGRYNGNNGGLDIRTSSNNIVLSDGDGNPRGYYSAGFWVYSNDSVGTALWPWATSSTSKQGIIHSQQGQIGFNHASANANIFVNKNEQAGTGIGFHYRGTAVGSISIGTSSTSYNTSSDYRLKENVIELTGATERLKQIPVHRFNFIADADTIVDGFLAHEVQAIVPEAVTGTKDEVDADGNPVYQGIDQSKLVPLLVATIKELEARIAALEAN